MNKNFDVIIVGGGTAGCSCAWNCGKLGLKTLLIEKESYLGGTMTGALVIPVMKSGENQINTDFYNELIARMHLAGGQITYQDNPGWFNPFILKDVLYRMLTDNGVSIILSACIDEIYTDNNIVRGFKMLSEYIEAKYIVDCTGNLNFCRKINCEIFENQNENIPMSLRFIMDGIDLKVFSDWLLEVDKDTSVTTVENIDGQIHLSTAYTWDTNKTWALAPYFDDAVSKKILNNADRNYFQVFTVPGMPCGLAFNCPRIVENLDSNDNQDIIKAKNLGMLAIDRIANFCKIYFPGFENAKIYKIADKVGIRSGARLKGKYVYKIEDIRSGKKFKQPAVRSNYPVDLHKSKVNTSILETNREYELPIESLISANYENVFTAGKTFSGDLLSQAALRVQASCFSMGEAVAKHISNINKSV